MNISPTDATRNEIEAAVTMWREVRAERLAAEKVAQQIKDRELELKDFIVAAMTFQKYEGIVKEGRMTYVRQSEVPMANDRLAFEQYVIETKDLSLMQFRPSVGAIRERMESGIEVPGITMVATFDLGDRKA